MTNKSSIKPSENVSDSAWMFVGIDNLTINNFLLADSDFLPDNLPSDVKTILYVIYSVLILGSFSANLSILLIIIFNRSLRNITNTFIVSLSVSNALMAAWSMPMQFIFHLTNEWKFGEAMCKMTSYIQGVSVISSIFALCAMSVERYRVICFPMRPRLIRTIKSAIVMVLLLWLTAVVAMIPQLWIQRQQQRLSWQTDATPPIRIAYLCVEYFPKLSYNICYTIGYFLLFYCVPILVMVYTYGRMAKVLWLRGHIGERLYQSELSNKRQLQKRNIIRMLMLIVLCYIICWLPFFAMHIFILFHDFSLTVRVVQAFALVFGYANSLINALIYFFMNAKLKRIIRKRLLCVLKQSPKPVESSIQLTHSTCASM